MNKFIYSIYYWILISIHLWLSYLFPDCMKYVKYAQTHSFTNMFMYFHYWHQEFRDKRHSNGNQVYSLWFLKILLSLWISFLSCLDCNYSDDKYIYDERERKRERERWTSHPTFIKMKVSYQKYTFDDLHVLFIFPFWKLNNRFRGQKTVNQIILSQNRNIFGRHWDNINLTPSYNTLITIQLDLECDCFSSHKYCS